MARLYNLARVSTATTGTGTITLGSAVAGFLSFAGAGVSDGETVTYAIKDGSNSEIGRGVYTSSGTTLTRSVIKSTNSNTAISLSGSAVVFITAAAEDFNKLNNTLGAYTVALAAGTNVTADRTLTITTGDANRTLDISAGSVTVSAFGATLVDDADASTARTTLGVRDVLTAARTYYVRTDGSDSNTGLVNSSGGALLTLQAAVDAASLLDGGTNNITINVATGTYNGAVLRPTRGTGVVSIVGTLATINAASLGVGIWGEDCGNWSLSGLTFVNGSYHILSRGRTHITIAGALSFGVVSDIHIMTERFGRTSITSNYSITGGGNAHWYATQGQLLCQSKTITLTGTPNFAVGFGVSTTGGELLIPSNTFSGSATGPRYSAFDFGKITTWGAGATYLPGSVAGSVSNGIYF